MHLKIPNFCRVLPVVMTFVFCIHVCAQAQQSVISKKPVFVIVHGAWGGSWAFREVDSLMTNFGAIVYRPSLTGQGERVHLASPEVTLSTHIDDVVNAILFEEMEDIVLVGHSYGGMVISGVADRIPDRIRRLVYLDAIVPRDGENVMDIMDPEGKSLKPMIRGDYLYPAWVKADQKPPKDVPHPLKTFTERIVLKNNAVKNIPSTYILTVEAGRSPAGDDFAGNADRARERGWKVMQMTADHNPQWSAPEELVRILMTLK